MSDDQPPAWQGDHAGEHAGPEPQITSGGWWSPAHPPAPRARRIVEETPNAPQRALMRRTAGAPPRRGAPPISAGQADARPWWRRLWASLVVDYLQGLVTIAVVAGLIVLIFNAPALLHALDTMPHGGVSPAIHGTRVTPTASPLPTATPTLPAQTELDGVVVITNLDSSVPFEGDVKILSTDGQYLCRNSPQPGSTWHVQLAPSGSLSLPCIIPATTPASLAPHTFRHTVTGAGGQGLALLDNPAPFSGTAFVPTPSH